MWWSRGQVPPSVVRSEGGFLALAGRETALVPREALVKFRDLVSADLDWADDRKRRNRRYATSARVGVLGLTASSTVVLGIPFDNHEFVALPMVALVLAALETYFNWRPLWVLMEETRYRLNRVRDHMDFYLVTSPAEQVCDERELRRFFEEQQDIWRDVSRQWIEFRRLDPTPWEKNRESPP